MKRDPVEECGLAKLTQAVVADKASAVVAVAVDVRRDRNRDGERRCFEIPGTPVCFVDFREEEAADSEVVADFVGAEIWAEAENVEAVEWAMSAAG